MGNCMDVDRKINETASINSENDDDENNNTVPTEVNITTVQQPTEIKPSEEKKIDKTIENDDESTTIESESKSIENELKITKTATPDKDRSKLVQLFRSSEDEFYEFVSDHSDTFIAVTIDIMTDKTADSKHERDLETMLFHELRNSPELWSYLDESIKHELKRKLLSGLNELEGVDSKILILAHIIAIISTFEEEWNELIPELSNLKVSKDGKLKTLRMIAGWNPDCFKVHSLQIAKVVYCEILNIDDANIHEFESVSLYRIMDAVIKNVNDVPLLMKIMKITLVFLLKTYIINTEQLKLFDESLNINVDRDTFNKMEFMDDESFETAKICSGIIFHIQFHHFDVISLELKDQIFFLSNMFLKMSANKINLGLIQFPQERGDWEEEDWHFACVAQHNFSIFLQWEENAGDYYTRYFKEMNDEYNLIENLVANIDYSMDESVWSFWPHVLHKLAENHVHYFWHKKDTFIPLFQQKHPKSAFNKVSKLKKQLYNQEWLAIRWFVRKHYETLYDQVRIPITEIILKYLSEYFLIDIVCADSDDKDEDCFLLIESKQNNYNLVQERIDEEIANTYFESTMEQEMMSNCVNVPFMEIPCIFISTPLQTEILSVDHEQNNFEILSIQLKLGWFKCTEDKSKWPKDGKYYICIQEFDVKNPLEPNNKNNKLLFKSKIFEKTTQDFEICKVDDINLKLNNGTFYIVYIVQLDPTLNEEEMNESYDENNTDYSIESNIDHHEDQESLYWKTAIGLPCTNKTESEMLMTTFVEYSVTDKKYQYSQGLSALYDITFNCV